MQGALDQKEGEERAVNLDLVSQPCLVGLQQDISAAFSPHYEKMGFHVHHTSSIHNPFYLGISRCPALFQGFLSIRSQYIRACKHSILGVRNVIIYSSNSVNITQQH